MLNPSEGVAIAASVHETAVWPIRLSPTRPQEVIDYEELLSERINALPHLVSGLVSDLLTDGVRRRALSCEERRGSI